VIPAPQEATVPTPEIATALNVEMVGGASPRN